MVTQPPTATAQRPAATAGDIAELLEPMRREILAHCYRMTGSVHDAEDLVQETYLRAWRAYHGFENRSSLRTWVFRIATNACLTHLEGRKRRPLPTGLGGPPADPANEPRQEVGVSWLEPMPDDLLWAQGQPDPAARAVSRESVRLAFVAALQHLTAQQRAVLLLRDVLAWRAREVAEALDLTVAGVNSTLQRARARMAEVDPEEPPQLPDDERRRALLRAYVEAFEAYDVAAIVDLLAADVVWEMPPFPEWYRGPRDVGRLISTWCPAQRAGDMRMLPTSANGEPVLALYMREEDGVHRAFHLQHIVPAEHGVARVTAFFGRELFTYFALPPELPPR
ncbi:sigma-70 family RNA polymerase sigma factor [Georgenia sp. 311]|uniref:Sigma-70 family RNA polymerase sigma factor n=1 Tax=Georgenia wutianyii TaxID=2585135 RepID=A0ABX5VKL3_9MICO|nr:MULTISPECIES: sigma-70 family RNA polymerase sigma factor [Georgenia]QDB78991.1 sigma-70 family RNA polymerase sigma factor [Georgenia wutianyii]TNC17241.1 sigma-70 family RNA polymerase sigma factor [Georgenia sp. 311]